jgi:hypothetical protein
MKKEITRLSLRTVKKIGKVSVRIQAVQDQLAKVRAAIDAAQQVDEALLEQLEQSPSETSLKEHENDLVSLQSRLQQLNWLEEQFNNSPLKKKSTLTASELLKLTDAGEQILQYIQELKINENEAEKNKRIEEDAKNKKSKKDMSFQKQQQQQQDQGGRLPYRRYYTESNIEIKVSPSGLHSQPRDSFVLILHFFAIQRSANKPQTTMFSPSRRNIDPDPIGGTTHRVVPDPTSCFARMTHPRPKRMSKTPLRWPH